MAMPLGFHLIIKPISAKCNLNCAYCYYIDKINLFPKNKNFVMDDAILELLIKQYINDQQQNIINFTWQGGEPTLLGIEYFEKILRIQQKYAGNKTITNDLQTNGTLLDEKWCEFLAHNNFLVGLSIDGPPNLHNQYRRDENKNSTCEKVIKAAELLNKHLVNFNTLTVINNLNAKFSSEVYYFLRDIIGAKYMQFIPCVAKNFSDKIAKYSVIAEDYGNFLNEIFTLWYEQDLGKIIVMNFEATLNLMLGRSSPLCFFANCCGKSLVIEHDGSVYSCDHFVDPKYYLGNIKTQTLGELAMLKMQENFGLNKLKANSEECKKCKYFNLCFGECPKNRFINNKNYLCAGLKKYFAFVIPKMQNIIHVLKESGKII